MLFRSEEAIRRIRSALIQRAREDGIAVDLDELERVGREAVEMAEQEERRQTQARQKSFDELVGGDGRLRAESSITQHATGTGTETTDSNVRRRGMAGFTAGAAAASDPFSDDALIMFDRDDDDDGDAPTPMPFVDHESGSRVSTAAVKGDDALVSHDVAPASPLFHSAQPEPEIGRAHV